MQTACGGLNSAGVPQNLPATAPHGRRSIANLAEAIGNKDGVLAASDFRAVTHWTRTGMATSSARTATSAAAPACLDFVAGMSCTLDVFVFVNHDQAWCF